MKNFTIPELREIYLKFSSLNVLRYTDRDGNQQVVPATQKNLTRIDGVNAKVMPLRYSMSFIDYLESL